METSNHQRLVSSLFFSIVAAKIKKCESMVTVQLTQIDHYTGSLSLEKVEK
jgi:hypothetical protein